MPCYKDVSLHGAMLNTVAHFLDRKECPKASGILRDNIFKFEYIPHVVSLQKVRMSERVKIFKWHLLATQFWPNAHILLVRVLNNLSMCQLYDKLLGAFIMYPLIKHLYNSIFKRYLRSSLCCVLSPKRIKLH